VFIQIADTYFHVVIESISATTLHQDDDVNQHQYSRRLAPWCFDDEGSFGTGNNKFFWGCGLNATSSIFTVANYTQNARITAELDSYVSLYTDSQELGYAVVRPAMGNTSVDWTGTGYALSTQCTAVPPAACTMTESNVTGVQKNFNCPKIYDGKDINGSFVSKTHGFWFYDFHEYVNESAPFTNSWNEQETGTGLKIDNSTIDNTTIQDSNILFRNPWRWLSQIEIETDPWDLPTEMSQSDLVWKLTPIARKFLLSCSTMGKPRYNGLNITD
jgi:hypothetical protein